MVRRIKSTSYSQFFLLRTSLVLTSFCQRLKDTHRVNTSHIHVTDSHMKLIFGSEATSAKNTIYFLFEWLVPSIQTSMEKKAILSKFYLPTFILMQKSNALSFSLLLF